MQVFFEFLDFGVVGWLGSGWAKSNVVSRPKKSLHFLY